MIYAGTVKSRSINAPAPGPDHSFTVVVHLPSGDTEVPGVRPWVLDYTENGVLTRPYPLSAVVLCCEIAGAWHFIFPNQSPHTETCG